MKNFIKIFLVVFLSVFVLSSCIGKNWGVTWTNDVSESGKKIELSWENANFVFKVDLKNADFLLSQYKKLLSIYSSWEEDKKEAKKAEEIINKFKNSSLEFVLLVDGLMKGYDEEPASILFSNLDKDVVSFAKDIKTGFNEKDVKDAKEMYEILDKKETLAEVLASWKDVWKSIKKQVTNIWTGKLEEATKIINSIEIWKKSVLVSVPSFKSDLKLTWKLGDNKWFIELAKNLKWNELFYIYAAGNNSEETLKNLAQIDVKPLNILVWSSINKKGVNLDLYIKMESSITEEQNKNFEKQTEELNKNLKNLSAMWLQQINQMIEDEQDAKVIRDAIESLKVKYTKLSKDTVNMNISITADLEKIFDIIQKTAKKLQEV